jgi:hypothetical protein
MSNCFTKLVACAVLFAGAITAIAGEGKEEVTRSLWRNPGNISARDLIYGPGGKQRAPGSSTYVFVEEDKDGNSPKFEVRDSQGVKWKVKVGAEARPETAATRLVWAVGYTTDEDYFVPVLRVRNMPAKLSRGAEFVGPDGSVRNARWERMRSDKRGSWHWAKNAFDDTRELNGLRVMMALLNNWDMKDSQNAIYEQDGEQTYVVADLGSTFGPTGQRWPHPTPRGDLERYERSDFIKKVADDYVDFAAPSWPMIFGLFPAPPLPYPWLTAPVRLFGRPPAPEIAGQRWIGKGVPREDVRWMAGLLASLSSKQIRDAFRAASYTPAEVEAFSKIVERRIAQLSEL